MANNIQEDHRSAETFSLVKHHVEKAVARQSPGPHVAATVFLACSHYGYIQPLFQQSFMSAGVTNVRIVDANGSMVHALERRIIDFSAAKHERRMDLPSIRVYTRSSLGEREKQSLLELIKPISRQTAIALEQVEVLPQISKQT